MLMKLLAILSILLVLWLIMAQSCMTFRVSDAEARASFAKKGVELTTHTITVNNFPLHYVQSGNDSFPTLVFVHGTPGSWNAFQDYLSDSTLLKHFRMISIDRPGFGFSNFGKALHLNQQSELIRPLFTVVDNRRPFWLVGHSLGGPMILKLAADSPGIARGLVIISGSNDPHEEKAERWRPYLFKTPLNYFIPGAFRPSNEELWYLKNDLLDLKDDLQKVTCPVYFIHGRKDTWVSPANVDYTKSMLPASTETHELWFPDGNHFIPWTKFDQIRDLLLSLN
jgi:pimeloyl-ACP methyl ester carboxylesterase